MAVEAGEYEIGPDNGDLLVYTRSAGMAGTIGHDLTLVVDDWSGTLAIAEDAADCSFEVTADLRSLRVIDGSGGAKPLTDGDRDEIAKNAQKSLGTGRHPTLTCTSESIAGDWESASAEATLRLHGTARAVRLAIDQIQPGVFRAATSVRQSEFGIKPYSAMLGALKIADDVEVKVTIGF